ncbi:hypothetical protein BGLA2_420054 [Burkholderia gladioli]|nr:hypothetical protein BGLA2_420054 [Burkholderia gladioli]
MARARRCSRIWRSATGVRRKQTKPGPVQPAAGAPEPPDRIIAIDIRRRRPGRSRHHCAGCARRSSRLLIASLSRTNRDAPAAIPEPHYAGGRTPRSRRIHPISRSPHVRFPV